MEEKILFWEALCVISFVLARNYLFKVSNLSTRIRYESCLILGMSMLTIFNINDVTGVALVSLLLTGTYFKLCYNVDFEQAKVCLVQIKKTDTLKTRLGISYILL